MNFDVLKNMHFIGIGGIGMSALARYFKALGKNVSGYDKTATTLTRQLEEEGMFVYYKEDLDLLPEVFRSNPNSAENLIVYTPAIPSKHAELVFFRAHQVTLYKRAEILGLISKNYPCIGIAGTHGKTTTTSLLTYIALTADMPFAAFVGGINENFNSNLVLNGDIEFVITEADEYDRSFLKLKPKHAILTSMDADHLDIYESSENMTAGFKEFAQLVDKNGRLLIQYKLLKDIDQENAMTYGLNAEASYHAKKVSYQSGHFLFDFIGPGIHLPALKLSLPGYHNLENATAAIAMASILGIDERSIRKALETYKGVKRRFEYHINREDFKYIDDYAHHPEEIKAVVSSLRKMYPGKKITGIFQPHLFSRTKDLAVDFAKSLSELDEVILLDIYPAREEPIEGITSEWLLNQVHCKQKVCCSKDNLMEILKDLHTDVLITLGAGDIDQMVSPIKTYFKA